MKVISSSLLFHGLLAAPGNFLYSEVEQINRYVGECWLKAEMRSFSFKLVSH